MSHSRIGITDLPSGFNDLSKTRLRSWKHNVDAIVMEDTPYMVAICTRYLGGSTENSDEISGWGSPTVGILSYVINEWHDVNIN